MDRLLESLERVALRASIQKCVENEEIDVLCPEYRFLLVQVEGLGTAAYALYQDHAATAHEIAGKVFERAPRTQSVYGSLPPFDRGAIFDAATEEILAYRVRGL